MKIDNRVTLFAQVANWNQDAGEMINLEEGLVDYCSIIKQTQRQNCY